MMMMIKSPRSILIVVIIFASLLFLYFTISSSATVPTNSLSTSSQVKHLRHQPPLSPPSASKSSSSSAGGDSLPIQQREDCSSFFEAVYDPPFFQVRLHGGGTVPLNFIQEAVLSLTKLEAEEHANDLSNETEFERLNRKEKRKRMERFIADGPERLNEFPLDHEDFRIVFWAADGTLLNFMRWGAIVNDNDVDVSFVVLPRPLWKVIVGMRGELQTTSVGSSSGGGSRSKEEFDRAMTEAAKFIRNAIVNKVRQREFYLSVLFGLVRIGVVERPDNRILKNLRQPFKAVKPMRCHIRRGFMQCRHPNGVMYDFFGPENSFVGRPGFSDIKDIDDAEANENEIEKAKLTLASLFFPLAKCKSYLSSEFPCPKESLKVLKSFSLDYSSSSSSSSSSPKLKSKKKTADAVDERNRNDLNGRMKPSWNEFSGCALFTRRSDDEHDSPHLINILKTTKKLQECGYPSLFDDRNTQECQLIISKAGLK